MQKNLNIAKQKHKQTAAKLEKAQVATKQIRESLKQAEDREQAAEKDDEEAELNEQKASDALRDFLNSNNPPPDPPTEPQKRSLLQSFEAVCPELEENYMEELKIENDPPEGHDDMHEASKLLQKQLREQHEAILKERAAAEKREKEVQDKLKDLHDGIGKFQEQRAALCQQAQKAGKKPRTGPTPQELSQSMRGAKQVVDESQKTEMEVTVQGSGQPGNPGEPSGSKFGTPANSPQKQGPAKYFQDVLEQSTSKTTQRAGPYQRQENVRR